MGDMAGMFETLKGVVLIHGSNCRDTVLKMRRNCRAKLDLVWVLFAGLGFGGQRNDLLDLIKRLMDPS